MITVKLIDREAVVNLVEGLEDFEKDRAIKAGLRSAVSVFKTAGKRNLRQRLKTPGGVTDNLMKSFTNKVKRTKLGALSGFARPAGNHAHLVDKGTKMRYTKKGWRRGIVPANNFWSDALVSEEPKAMGLLYSGVERAVQRINNRR